MANPGFPHLSHRRLLGALLLLAAILLLLLILALHRMPGNHAVLNRRLLPWSAQQHLASPSWLSTLLSA
ncbi:MAG: hypothetical protein ACRD11_05225 [Terriglobia bacterium]